MHVNDQDILVAVITVTILFFLFSVFTVIYFLTSRLNKKKHLDQLEQSKKEYEQQLLQSQVEVQESTYKHIAKDLHDNVGQLLSTTKMLLGITERNIEHIPDTLLTAHATLGQAIHELRSLSKSLDKEWLEQFSLMDNLQAEISRINAGGTLKVSCNYTNGLELRSDEQIILFRIIQEGLQNSIKHSNSTEIEVFIESSLTNILVTIADNGSGFDEKLFYDGMGLKNMKHRTKLMGGNIQWISSPDSGTTVNIHLPIKPQRR